MYADDELPDFDSGTSPEREQEGNQPSGEALPVSSEQLDEGQGPAPMQVDQGEEVPVQDVVLQVDPAEPGNPNEEGPAPAEEVDEGYDSSDPDWQRHFLRPGGPGREMLGRPAYRPSQPNIYGSARYQRGFGFLGRPAERKERSHRGRRLRTARRE